MKHLFTLKRRLLGLLSLTALFVLISALPAMAQTVAQRNISRCYDTGGGTLAWTNDVINYSTVNAAAQAGFQGSQPPTWTAGDSYFTDNTVTMTDNSEETFTIPSGITVNVNNHNLTASGASTNNGTISGGSLIVNNGVALTNAGTITMENNSLILYGTLANSGKLTNTSGGAINIYGGALNITAGTANSIAGTTNVGSPSGNYSGSLTVTSGTLTNTGTINVNKYNSYAGTLTVNGGTLANTTGTINNNYAINVSSGTLSNGGTVTNNNGATITVSGGTFSNTNTVTDNGTFNISATGAVTNSGTFTVGSTTGSLNLANTSGTGFNNSGTLTNNGTLSGAGTLSNSKTFTNSGTYSFTGKVTNSGTFSFSGETDKTANLYNFDNTGTFSVDGNVKITIPNTYTLSNTGENAKVTIADGSELDVTGTLTNTQGTVTNNGILKTTKTTGTIDVVSGELINNKNFTNDGTFTVESAGKFTDSGDFVDNGTSNISGTVVLNKTWTINTAFTNGAKFAINSGAVLTVGTTGSLTNDNEITIAEGGQLINNNTVTNKAGKTITNNGTLNNSKDNTINNSGSIVNNSTFNNNGTLNNKDAGTIANSSQGTLTIGTDGTLNNASTADKAVDNSGALVNNGTFTGTGKFTNETAGTFTNSKTYNPTGAVTNDGTANFIGGGTDATLTSFTNNGTLNVKANTTVKVAAAGTLTNNADKTINIESGSTLEVAGTLSNGGTVVNKGTLLNDATGKIDVLDKGIISNKGTLTNNGTPSPSAGVYVENGGTLNNDLTYTNNEYFFVDQNGSFNQNGDFTDNGTSDIYGVFVQNGNWTIAATYNNYAKLTINKRAVVTVTGTLNNYNGIIVNEGGTLDNKGKVESFGTTTTNPKNLSLTGFITNNGTLTNEEAANLKNDAGSTFTNNSSLFTNPGTFTNEGAFINTAKTFTNEGTLTNQSSGTVSNTGELANSGTLNNNATATVSNTGTLTNSGTLSNTSTADKALDNSGAMTNSGTLTGTGKFANEASGTFTNSKTYTLTGDVTNAGTVTFGDGSDDTTIDNFNNTGKLYINGTTKVTLAAEKTLTNATNSLIEIEEGSSLNINGTLNDSGKITNNGTLATIANGKIDILTGGTLDNNKTLTNVAGGEIDVEQGGTLSNNTGATYDNNGTFNVKDGATFNANGTFNDHGTSTFGNANLNVYGAWNIYNATTNKGNLVIYKDGKITTVATGTLTNDNTILVKAGGTLENNTTLTNNAGKKITNEGILDNTKTATFDNNGTYINSLTFNNEGIFNNKENASFTNAKTGTMTNPGTFNNAGAYVNAGAYNDQVTVEGAGTTKGTLTNTKTIDNQATGTMTINGTLDTQNGTYNNDGNIEIKNAATLIDKTRTDGQAFSMTGAGTMKLDSTSVAYLGTEKFISNTADSDIQSAGNFTVTNAKFGVPTGNQQIIKSYADAVTINKPITIPAGVVYDFSSATTTTKDAATVVTVNGTFVDKASANNMPSIAGPGKFVYNVGSYGYLGDLLLIDKTGAVMDLEKGTIEVTANTITLPSGADVTITQDWTNPAGETFAIETGAVLGITSHTFTNAGALDVEGTMNVNNSGTYIIKDQGTEEVNGMINVKSAGVYKDSRANSTWTGEGTINYYDGSEGWLGDTKYIGKKADTAALMQLASGIIELKAPGTTVGDKTYTAGVMTLKANSEAFSNGFTLAANQLATVEPGAKLSIADGAKLNIDGDLVINDKGQVIVPNNTTYTIENAGTEQIDGKITVENGGKFYDTRTAPVIKAGSLGYIEYMAGSEGYLGTTKYIGKDNTAKIALTSGSIKLDVLNADSYANGEMTLVAGSKATSNDFASSKGQLMTIQKGATLDIYNDKSFTNNGDLVIDGTDGTLDVTAKGTYVNNGNQKVNGIIHVENTGTIQDNTAPYTVNGTVKLNNDTAAGKIIYELGGMGYHGEDAYIGPKADTYPLQLTYGKIEQVYEANFVGDHYTLTDGSKASANNYTLSGDPENRHLTIAKNAELTVTKAKAITIDGTLTIDKEGKLIVPSNATYTIENNGVEQINGEIILQRAQNGVVGGTFNDNRTVPYMAGVGSIVYYSGAQGKVSGHLFIGGPKDTGADVQITDSDGALILHSGDVANTTIYEVASGSEVTSNALKLRVGEKVTLHNAAMVTIPSGKSLTLLDPNSTSQVIFEPQPNNYVTTINLQGNLIMNANGKTLTFTSAKPEYELLLKSLPEVNTTTGTITFPVAKKGISGDSIVWRSTSGNTDYKAGDTYTPAGAETFVANVVSSTSQNVSKSTKIANGSFDDIVYGNYNAVDYTISNPNTAAGSAIPTNSELKTLTITLTGENADMFWLTPAAGTQGTTVSESNITIGTSKDFTVTTKKDGSTYLDAGTYHATIVITGMDALGNTITDSVQIKQVVLKNTPILSALSASALTYGQTLSESTVTGTATPATNTAGLTIPVAGTYAFTDATLIPEVETEDYEVTFTPTDTKNYNIATGMVSVSVTPVDMSKVTLAPITDQPYTSNFVTPTLSLTYKGMPLVEYEDYQVVYGNNVELSTTNSPATVSIIGMGNYKGTLKSTFKIVNSDLLYFVSIPQVSGITSNPVAGTYYEYKGETFTFSLTLGKTYSKSAPVVKDTEGNVYKADANGIYSIKIDHSVILSIDGVTSNTTGIESLNGMKIWAVGHVLHIYTTKASPVLVVSMNGRMIVSDKLTVGDNSFNIDVEGTYIVKLGSQVVKIYVR